MKPVIDTERRIERRTAPSDWQEINGASWDTTSAGINRNDVAWWAHSTDAGRADDGMTRGFQLPTNFNGDYSELWVTRLKPVQWTTTNKPVFSLP